jgi:DNA ligase-1
MEVSPEDFHVRKFLGLMWISMIAIRTGFWQVDYGVDIINLFRLLSWFLDQLPNWPLDGELWCGRGRFQETMSTCKKLEPIDSEWEKVQYCVFDIPTLYQFLKPGLINLPNFRKEITQDMWEWIKSRFRETNKGGLRPNVFRFGEVVDYFVTQFPQLSNVQPIIQWYNTFGIEGIENHLDLVDVLGGEGIVIRNPYSYWIPERSGLMLKMKKFQEAEAIVVGYIGGKKTDRGSKLLGINGCIDSGISMLMRRLFGLNYLDSLMKNES